MDCKTCKELLDERAELRARLMTLNDLVAESVSDKRAYDYFPRARLAVKQTIKYLKET